MNALVLRKHGVRLQNTYNHLWVISNGPWQRQMISKYRLSCQSLTWRSYSRTSQSLLAT